MFLEVCGEDLDGKGDSSFSVEDAEAFFKQVYSSSPRVFERPEWLPSMNAPQCTFNDGPITISEITEVIKRTKSSSSPSPIDIVSYQVFKRCPTLLTALADLYNACWELQTLPLA